MRAKLLAVVLAPFVFLWTSASVAEDATSLVDAIVNGDAGLSFRYRYEFVDDARFNKNANASTLRTRLNFETQPWQGWSGLVEFDHVLEVLLKDFNSGAGTSGPNRDRYPVVADPDGPDLNQMYVQYALGETWRARLGRQRIILDDQRFVGGVGWRQNEQTYDAVSIKYDGWRDTSFFYSYVANVARIFGDSVPAGNHEQSTHLVNANVELLDDLKVTGYAYLIDNDDAPAFSTKTFGIRVDGGIALGDGRLGFLGEIAAQSNYGDAPASYDAEYFRLQALWAGGPFTTGIGFESLGADNGQAFRTPLATLHAFNGWADQFLTTPADGLEDLYVRFGYGFRQWEFAATWHEFSAESGNADYGSEIDLSAARKLGERYDLLFKLASFDADDAGFDDVLKAWIMMSADF